jgi:hypothetical protein
MRPENREFRFESCSEKISSRQNLQTGRVAPKVPLAHGVEVVVSFKRRIWSKIPIGRFIPHSNVLDLPRETASDSLVGQDDVACFLVTEFVRW